MGKLTSRPTSRVLKALARAGWQTRKSHGRHYVLVHLSLPGIVTVPRHPKIKKGTLRSIIQQAGLTVEQFEELYR